MSNWAGFTSLAKTAFVTAQKRIDQVLDIQEDGALTSNTISAANTGIEGVQDDFFTAFGISGETSSTSVVEPVAEPVSSSRSTFSSKNLLSYVPTVGQGTSNLVWSQWLGGGSAGRGSESTDHDAFCDNSDDPNVDLVVSGDSLSDGWNVEPLVVPSDDVVYDSLLRETSPGSNTSSYPKFGSLDESLLTPADKRWTFGESSVQLSFSDVTDPMEERCSSDKPKIKLSDTFHGVEDDVSEPTSIEAEQPLVTLQSLSNVDDLMENVQLADPDSAFMAMTTGLQDRLHGSLIVSRSGISVSSDNSVVTVIDTTTKEHSLINQYDNVPSPLSHSLTSDCSDAGDQTCAIKECIDQLVNEVSKNAFHNETIITHSDNSSSTICSNNSTTNIPLEEVDCLTSTQHNNSLECSFVQLDIPAPGDSSSDGGDSVTADEQQLHTPVAVTDDNRRSPSDNSTKSISPPNQLDSTRLSDENNTNLCLNKGSGQVSPSETATTSDDIEILSNPTNGDNSSERSFRSLPGGPPNFSLIGSRTHDEGESRTHRRINSDQSSTISCDQPEDKIEHELPKSREAYMKLQQENQVYINDNADLRKQKRDLDCLVESYKKNQELKLVQFETLREQKNIQAQKIRTLETQLAASANVAQLHKSIKEKDEQIESLAKEGEKLSKQELKHTTIIKKLREQEKENVTTMENQRKKLHELEELRNSLSVKEGELQKYDASLFNVQSAFDKQEKQSQKLKSEIEDQKEKVQNYKSLMEKSCREATDLNKQLVSKDAEIAGLRIQLESIDIQQMQSSLLNQQKDSDSQRQMLLQQIEDLRISLVHTHEENQRKEDSFKWEISQLQKKLQDAETRNQDLSESTSSATKPLLRQIESLRTSFGSQQTNWERMEKSLFERVAEAEKKCADGISKEQQQSVVEMELKSKITHLEAQLQTVSGQNAKLQSDLLKSQDERKNFAEKFASLERSSTHERSLHKRTIDELEKEKDLLSTQFDYEKVQVKQQQEQRINELTLALRDKETQVSELRQQVFDHQQQLQHRQPETSSYYSEWQNNNTGLVSGERVRSPSVLSSITPDEWSDELWSNGDINNYGLIVEKLRAKLQQRETELASLKGDIRRSYGSREAAAIELGKMSAERQDLKVELEEKAQLELNMDELQNRYDALLQLFGERVEQLEETKLDLLDTKEAYKAQIEDLLGQLEQHAL